MTTPANVYPFATQDGKAIPLDILRPSGIMILTFQVATESFFIIPNGYEVGIFFSPTWVLARFGQPFTVPVLNNTLYTDALIIPSGTMTVASLTQGPCYIKGLTENGTLYLQLIEKWAGLALDKQYIRK